MLEEPKIKKVDKRDKQLPQNFEQLIEMYDVEKIWPHMKKVIDYINNDLEKIKVSPTKPTTNEKVWIQKGKNLFNVNQLNVLGVSNASYSVQNDQINITSQAQFSSIDLLVKVIPNKQHYISMDVINSVAGRVNVSIYSKDYSTHYIQQWILDSTYGRIGLTFTTSAEEIVIRLYSNAGGEVTNNTATFSNIQLEQGSTPTEYEAYVEKTIWCKNDNDVYEDFLDVEKANNQQNYSTEEQVIGTWIDGKPLYRITKEFAITKGHNPILQMPSNISIKSCRAWLNKESGFGNLVNWNSSTANTGDFAVLYSNPNTGHIHINTSDGGTISLIIEYTKTTD